MSYVVEKLAADSASVCIHHHLAFSRKYEAMGSRIIDSPPIDYSGNHSFTHVILPTNYNASHLQRLTLSTISLLNVQLDYQHYHSQRRIYTSVRIQRFHRMDFTEPEARKHTNRHNVFQIKPTDSQCALIL
jgi:hypothetical protein